MTNKAKRLSGINTLAYLGIEPITAPLLLVEQRIPTTDDRVGNQIGALWILEQTDTVPARIFLLVRLQGSGPSGIATWVELTTGGGGGGIDQINTDNGIVLPAGGIINELGGTSVGGVATNINTFANPNMSNNMFIALNNSIFFPDTTDINNGVIGFGGSAAANRFIHNFGAGGGADGNTFVGLSSGNFTLTGIHLVGIGDGALISTTSGSDNVAVGSGAGSSITAGNNNITIGSLAGASMTSESDNTVVGSNAMTASITSIRNVAIGSDALLSLNTDAFNTIAIGVEAGRNLQRSSSAVLIGYQAGMNINSAPVGDAGVRTIAIGTQAIGAGILTGNENIMIGFQSGNALTTGNLSIGIGSRSLTTATTSARNTVVGYQGAALIDGGTANDNVVMGYNAMSNATTSGSNVIIGSQANLLGNPSSNVVIGFNANAADLTGSTNTIVGFRTMQLATNNNRNVVAIGHRAGEFINGNQDLVAIGTNALSNAGVALDGSIAIGRDVLSAATTSGPHVGVGYRALASVTTTGGGGGGRNNTAIGTEALTTTATSLDNTAVGHRAMFSFTNGAADAGGNACLGASTLRNLTTGINNTAVGANSGSNGGVNGVTTGSFNVFVGAGAGQNYTGAEASNIIVGSGVGGTVGESNTIRIGIATGAGSQQQNRCFIMGIRGITTGVADAIAVLVDSANQLGTVSSSARYKDNIQDMGEESSPVMELRPVTFTYKNDEQQRMQYGLIAEEVDKTMPRLVVYDEEGLPQSVRYNDLPQLLLNELKKLEKRVAHLERLCDTCKHIC